MVVRRSSILLRGFDDVFLVPHSRHTTVRREDVEAVPALKILAASPVAGLYALSTEHGKQVFITGHGKADRQMALARKPALRQLAELHSLSEYPV